MQNYFSRRAFKLPKKLFSYIWVPCELLLESVKCLNPIFWVTEYCYKARKRQIWPMNKKFFSWESDANLETFQRAFSHTGVFYKLVLKYQKPKSNPLSNWILVQGFKMLNFLNEDKTNFLGKQDIPWNFPKSFSLYCSFL